MILFVGDDIVDLYPSAQLFYTVQRADIGSLSNRSVSFTTAFKAPWTENNERIFGFAKQESSGSTTIYTLRGCRIENNGSAITKDSVLYITKSEDKEFSLQLYETIFDYFLSVNDKNLDDINPIAPSGWRATDIDAARLNTDGIFTALIYWGISLYSVDYFLPSFYYHTLITAILEFTGLEIEGDILTDARFTDLVVPFSSEFEYPETYYKQFDYSIAMSSAYPVVGSINAETSFMSWTPAHYGHGTLFVRVSLGGISFGSGTALVLYLRKNGVLVATKHMAAPPAPGVSRELEYTDFFEPGDYYEISVYSNALVGPGISYTIAATAGATYLKFTADGVVNRDLVNWNALWPEISCTNLLKEFFNRFGIIPNQVDNRLILKTLEEIVADVPGAVDWSSKLVNVKEKEISFKTEYAQSNLFRYVNKTKDPNLGAGSIDIANNTLPLKKNLFDSIFGNSNMLQTLSWYLATIPAFDPTVTLEDDEFTAGRQIVGADDLDQTDEGHIVTLIGGPYNLTADLLTANTRILLRNTGAGTVTIVAGVGVEVPGGAFTIPSGSEVIIDYRVPAVPDLDKNETYSGRIVINEDPGLRILTLKERTIEGDGITFDSVSRNDYKIGYFVDPDLPKDTGFEYFLGQFYPSLTSALQRNKIVTKQYNLTENDIFSYDPHKMVYDGDGYYLINKIVNFYPGKVTKVELFKVM